VDVSKFKSSDWLKIGGGAVFFIAGFLTWWKVEAGGFSDSGNAFDWFFTGTLPWLIFTAIAVLTVLAATGKFTPPAHLPAPLIYLAAAAIGLFLVLVRFISDGIDGDEAAAFGVDISRGIGLYLAVLAAIAVLVGCVKAFKESGGDLNDLKDFNKLKSAFGSGGSGSAGSPPPPPPPPAGGMPPPPPPPV
jgi:hypothetical protein